MLDQYSRPVKMAVAVTVMLALAVALGTVVLMQRGFFGSGTTTPAVNPAANTDRSQGAGVMTPSSTTPGGQPAVVTPPAAEIKQDPGAPKLLTPEEVLKERGITATPPPVAPPAAPAAPAAPSDMPKAPAAPSAPAQQ